MKKRLLSVLLIGLLSTTILGCNIKNPNSKNDTNKTETKEEKDDTKVTKEEAFTTVPEDNIVPEFVKSQYEKEDEVLDDFLEVYNALVRDVKSENYENVQKKLHLENASYNSTCQEIHDCNPDFYSGFAQFLLFTSAGSSSSDMSNLSKEMIKMAQDYIAYTLQKEKNDVVLAPEFAKLDPQKYVQKYLKENNIEIKNIGYPQDWTSIHIGSGSTILRMEVIIEGTQDGEEFSVTKQYDFHFTAADDLRAGGEFRYKNCVALIAVTDSCFKEEKYGDYQVDKFLELVK